MESKKLILGTTHVKAKRSHSFPSLRPVLSLAFSQAPGLCMCYATVRLGSSYYPCGKGCIHRSILPGIKYSSRTWWLPRRYYTIRVRWRLLLPMEIFTTILWPEREGSRVTNSGQKTRSSIILIFYLLPMTYMIATIFPYQSTPNSELVAPKKWNGIAVANEAYQ